MKYIVQSLCIVTSFIFVFFIFNNPVEAASIEIISPTPEQQVEPSDFIEIKWTQSDDVSLVRIYLCDESGNTNCRPLSSSGDYLKSDGVYTYNFYNNYYFSDSSAGKKYLRVVGYNPSVVDEVTLNFLPGKPEMFPDKIGDAYVKILSPNGGEVLPNDSVKITWEQYGIEKLFTLQILNNYDASVHMVTSQDLPEGDGIHSYTWQVPDHYKEQADFSYKVKIVSPLSLPSTNVNMLSDESDEYFNIEINEEVIKTLDMAPVQVQLNTTSLMPGEYASVTWSSECKAPFIDVWLVRDAEDMPGWEQIAYLTAWSPASLPYSNNTYTPNVGQFNFQLPKYLTQGFINKTYFFYYRLQDDSLKQVFYNNTNSVLLESGEYRVRVRLRNSAPSTVLMHDGKILNTAELPSCNASGISELISIGTKKQGSTTVVDDSTQTVVTAPKTVDTTPKTDNDVRVEKEIQHRVLDRERARFHALDQNLVNRLRGNILLQVEESGEAWYIPPERNERFYMKDRETAFQMLRNFGLGVKNIDLAKIPIGIETRFADVDTDGDGLPDKLEEGLKTNANQADSDNDGYDDGMEILSGHNPLGSGDLLFDQSLANRLRGKILLQVEDRGQAWYINPADGKRYYMKNGEAAFQIMRYLSLGITNGDLSKIPISE